MHPLNTHRRLQRRLAAGMLGTVSIIGAGFINSCDDRLIGLTQYVELCGTVFANCAPGDFQTNRANIGDYCVDPSCTVPGGCANGQPLGTITDVCP